MTKKIWYRSQANPLDEITTILFHDKSEHEQFFLFWSRARWDYDTRSDYDIAITTTHNKVLPLERALRLQSQLNELPRKVDLIDLTRASPFFKQEIEKDMIRLN